MIFFLQTSHMLSLPNCLTFGRIVLTCFMAFFLMKEQFVHAFICLFFAGLSDFLDGFLARRFHQESFIGELLDPIADKFLMIVSFVMLSVLSILPWWLTILFILRDVLILMGFFYISQIKKIKVRMPPLWTGKLNTVLQLFLIALCIGGRVLHTPSLPVIETEFYFWTLHGVLFLTLLTTIVSSWAYIKRGFNIARQ